jgi:integrase/recombinase XerD
LNPGLEQSVAVPIDANEAIDALWLSRDGRRMRAADIRQQIKQRTKAAFGLEVWPHLFRDCAVTELVDMAPGEIGIAADLLGHTSLQTTTRHYIQARGMTAHHRMQEMLESRRSEP